MLWPGVLREPILTNLYSIHNCPIQSDLLYSRVIDPALVWRCFSDHSLLIQRLRLVGGSHDSEGRLEVLHNGVWGTVCDDNFGDDDAKAICGILEFPLGILNSRVGQPGTGRIWLDDVSFN